MILYVNIDEYENVGENECFVYKQRWQFPVVQ